MPLPELQGLWPSGDRPFHVTDVETTGTSPGRDEVLEIATVTVLRGEVVGRYQRLIKPAKPIPAFITKLTGIDNAMVAEQAGRDAVMADWVAYLKGFGVGHFVAHNAPFDLSFMRTGMYLAQQPWPFPEAHLPGCTVAWARKAWPHLKSRSLGALIAHFGLEVDARHRALADAEATATLMGKLARGEGA